MAHNGTVSLPALLATAGLLVQGGLVVREERASGFAVVLILLFGGLALLCALSWRRPWSAVACAASLGGVGMAVGRMLDGTSGAGAEHCLMMGGSGWQVLSWSSALMLFGCAAGCAVEPRARHSRAAFLTHQSVGLAAMLLAMQLPLLAERWGAPLPSWALHPAMLASMALGAGVAYWVWGVFRKSLSRRAPQTT